MINPYAALQIQRIKSNRMNERSSGPCIADFFQQMITTDVECNDLSSSTNSEVADYRK